MRSIRRPCSRRSETPGRRRFVRSVLNVPVLAKFLAVAVRGESQQQASRKRNRSALLGPRCPPLNTGTILGDDSGSDPMLEAELTRWGAEPVRLNLLRPTMRLPKRAGPVDRICREEPNEAVGIFLLPASKVLRDPLLGRASLHILRAKPVSGK